MFPSSQDAVIRLRQKLNFDKTNKQSVEEDLTADGNQVKQKTRELREQLNRAQTAARKQLTDLTVQSDNATKKLQAAIAKVKHLTPSSPTVHTCARSHSSSHSSSRSVVIQGERVLRLAEMYHKLEREQKNVSSTLFLTEERRPERTGPETAEPAKVRF